ncbi:hypothetical protein F0U62_41520 [Cystobacter fuscus]|uniref:hypothetical protein n=1 Tax=Cystobacter fuscus TaxID=43 RepID=UPI002B2E0316|nr:hypothetical protein F0U62_41520 [Cystobacter fuscus]
MYPDEFRLPRVSEHVLAWLERRRPGFGEWDESVEASLRAEARLALDDVERRFAELAVDAAYVARLEHSLFSVALPRYLRLACEHHALQRRKYGLWREGDLVSRAVYTLVGIVLAVVIALTRVPNWLEPLPLALILVGPFLPDLQESFLERRYRRRLAALVADMVGEQHQFEAYQPLSEPPESLPGTGSRSDSRSKEPS